MLKKLSYILTVITLICTMAFAAGCGSKNSDDKQAAPKASFRSIADIKQSGKLIIGVFSDKAPFGYIDKEIIRDMMYTSPSVSPKTWA